MANELKFTIPEATPRTLPMVRLAEYLKRLAAVFGHQERVHFLRMEEGSASAVAEMDSEIETLVVDRTRRAALGEGPKEAVYGYQSVQEMLEEDGYTAEVTRNGDLVARFVPEIEQEHGVIGPIWQEGTLDGLVVRIEGVDETIHVTLISDGRRYPAETNRERGIKLGPLFYRTVRITGKGKWWRDEHGLWQLEKFIFQDIEQLEQTTLPDAVARLREIPGNDLKRLTDPIGEMLKIRHGEE